MKNYFLQLFEYDRATNLQTIKNIFETAEPLKAVQLMAHILAAQQIWLQRCTEQTGTSIPLWPDWQTMQFTYIIEDTYNQYKDFLNSLSDDDFAREISYQNSAGINYTSKIIDVLTHVVNHGTHHRAQIGQIVKQSGLEKLPSADYIFFIRNK